MGDQRPGVRGLPRSGVGPPAARRPGHLRTAVPGGVPVRVVLADHPAQTGELPRRVRRVRPGRRGQVRCRRRAAAAGRHRHRQEPGQDQRRHRQRAGRAGHRRRPVRPGLELRRRARAGPGDHGRRPGPDRRVQGPVQGAARPRLHVHRAGHGLRDHAGLRDRQRPPGRLLRPARRGRRGHSLIVTVTLNAALDVAYEAESPSWQATRDVSRVRHRAGGSGVAVARVLYRFGHEVVVAGLAGGATGELIKEDLGRSGIPVALTGISSESRRVLAVTDTVSGQIMRLREPGPYVTTEELGRFAGDYRRLLADATAVILSGSLPLGMPPEIFGSLATYAAEAGVPVIVNAGGEALRHAVTRRPDLVVPDGDGDEPAAADETSGSALLALGAAAVAIPAGERISVATKAGQWSAALPGLADGSAGY